MGDFDDLVNRTVGKLPQSIRDRILPGRRRLIRDAGTTPISNAAVRLLIAPLNSAGQGRAWARAAERLPDVSAANFMYRDADDTFQFVADHEIPTELFVTSRRWQRLQRAQVERRFTHVIVESGRHVFGTQGSVQDQLARLRRRGVEVALVWHGSDIRVPSDHARREPDSPFRGGDYPGQQILERIALDNRRLAAESGVLSFVSTPDLLAFVPGAVWLPVVVDSDRWQGVAVHRPVLHRRRPVVVHAPSRSALKGSRQISAAVRTLHAEGVIEYREVSGVPADKMLDVYGDADIVLDQFMAGAYGVAACEGMAAGRLVVSHVAEDTRIEVRTQTGMDLPVVQSRAVALEGILRRIVAERDRYQRVAEDGRTFVQAVHSGDLSAHRLAQFLGRDVEVFGADASPVPV